MPSILVHLLAPFALLLPVMQSPLDGAQAGGVQADGAPVDASSDMEWHAAGLPDAPSLISGQMQAQRKFLMQRIEPEAAEQVRIDQRLIIRIAPRAPRRDPDFDVPRQTVVQRFDERATARCLPVQGIAGVQVSDGRLMLFMRDRRIIGMNLEKSCRPRDFYSGFYVERTSDGRICAGRDDAHSRAGTTCAISRLRELVPED